MIPLSDPAPRRLRVLATLTILAATILSLVNLPSEQLPVEWLLAFTLPGALLGGWSRLRQAPWRRALLAVAMQASACYAALELVGPMTRPAALACTILPPLAFATTRNHDADPSLALFLSFCVLLVGIILDDLHLPLLLAYGIVAFLSLHASTLLASHRSASMRHRPKSPVRAMDASATSLMTLSCLLAMFAIDRTLRCLPSPSSGGDQQMASSGSGGGSKGPRTIGLDDSFVLDGDAGSELSNLKGEQLVRVARTDGQPVGERMYLRCGFFSSPSMDRWDIGPLQFAPARRGDRYVIRQPWPGLPMHHLDVERYAGAAKFVFLPPSAIMLDGLSDLRVDRQREWIRPHVPNDDFYSVRYQDLGPPEPFARFDPRAAELGMLQLPSNLDRDALIALMNEWGVTDEPLQAMDAIRVGLAQRCRYMRREPEGPFPHAIENFLFADGDRYGYCMHFASAAALMLRLRGIPCRVGVGLYGGVADRNNALARMYGSQHAHAWVELPFEGHGYHIYDPTPPDSRGRGFVPDEQTKPKGFEGNDAQASSGESSLAALAEFLTQPWLWAIVLAAVLLFAITPRRQPKPPATPEPAFARHARRSLVKLLRALAAAGHTRSRGMTLELFAKELARRERLRPEVKAAFAAYQEVRFGGRRYDDTQHERMERGVRAAIAMRDDQRRDDEATGQ